MITAEVAVYPLKSKKASEVINQSIDALGNTNVRYQVDEMKTHLTGTNEEVFRSLESMFDTAQHQGGEVSMVITITNAAQ